MDAHGRKELGLKTKRSWEGGGQGAAVRHHRPCSVMLEKAQRGTRSYHFRKDVAA